MWVGARWWTGEGTVVGHRGREEGESGGRPWREGGDNGRRAWREGGDGGRPAMEGEEVVVGRERT